ncbi:MAG: hypothetical protein AB8F94_07360 [Saprospiraceae bacterium]
MNFYISYYIIPREEFDEFLPLTRIRGSAKIRKYEFEKKGVIDQLHFDYSPFPVDPDLIDTLGSVLRKVIDSEKDLFPKYKVIPKVLLIKSQISLFPNYKFIEKKVDSKGTLPSLSIDGQDDYLYNYGVNYIDSNNVLRVNEFFKRTNLEDRNTFISILKKANSKYAFTEKTKSIEERLKQRKNIEDEIWSLNDQEWFRFSCFQTITNYYHGELIRVINFYKKCQEHQGAWIFKWVSEK